VVAQAYLVSPRILSTSLPVIERLRRLQKLQSCIHGSPDATALDCRRAMVQTSPTVGDRCESEE
jgi:hypothetical protein